MMQRTVAVLVLAGCSGAAVCGEGDFSGFDCEDDAAALAELASEVAALEEENAGLQDEIDQVEEDVAGIQPSVDVEVITVECGDEELASGSVFMDVSIHDDGFVGAQMYSFASQRAQDEEGAPWVYVSRPDVFDDGVLLVGCRSLSTDEGAPYYTHHDVAVTWLLD